MNYVLDHGEDAGFHAQQALIAAQVSGEPYLLGQAQLGVGLAWEVRSDFDRAAAAYAEAIPLLRASGDDAIAWYVQAELADKLIWRGDLEAGIPMLDEALPRLRQISPGWYVVLVIGKRGHAALRQGDLPGAARWFAESIEGREPSSMTRTLLSAVTGLAGVALALGQAERAARILGTVEASRESLGFTQIAHLHHAERIEADTRAALSPERYERAWSAGRLLKLEEAVSEALGVADEVLMRSQRPPGCESSSV